MSYQTVAFYTQIATMVLFMALFVGVLIYALMPSNKAKFDRAARMPLEDEARDERIGGGHGRG